MMDGSVSLLPSLHLFVSGAACVTLGIALLRRRDWAAALLRFAGGPEAGERELRWFPRGVAAVGLAWLAVFLAECFPFPHGQRPFLVPLLNIVLLLFSALAVVVLLLWAVLLRRLIR